MTSASNRKRPPWRLVHVVRDIKRLVKVEQSFSHVRCTANGAAEFLAKASMGRGGLRRLLIFLQLVVSGLDRGNWTFFEAFLLTSQYSSPTESWMGWVVDCCLFFSFFLLCVYLSKHESSLFQWYLSLLRGKKNSENHIVLYILHQKVGHIFLHSHNMSKYYIHQLPPSLDLLAIAS